MRITLILLGFTFFAISCKNKEVEALNNQVVQLENQVEHLQSSNSNLLDRMADLSVISKEGAESIKQSLENMGQQYAFIENLTKKVQSKDSLNLALVMNLKRSLSDINDEDIQVEVKGGVVYVSISDKLLFRTGSYRINQEADQILGKIASIINDHDQLEVIVEGHTDNVPINNEKVSDNWELSVLRATAVVKVLTDDYLVDPQRLTAAGRSQYVPKADNESPIGRSMNRRTEIILQPRMDQFFQLLEDPVIEG